MRRAILVLSIIIFLFGCAKKIPVGYHQVNGSYLTENEDESCIEVYRLIQKGWFKHNTYNCHHYNKKLIKQILNHEECFIGKDTSFISTLFGLKKFNLNLTNIYSVSNECSEDDNYVGQYDLGFYAENGIVKFIKFKENLVLD